MTHPTQEISTSKLTPGKVLTRIRAVEFNQTQEEFRQFLGFKTRVFLSYMERDKKIPSRANIARIINKLQRYCTPEELAVLENWGQPTTKETA